MYNDPSQFLDHYYHFIAELLLGTWAFLYGAFNSPRISPSLKFRTPSRTPRLPDIDRAIFMHTSSLAWRDRPGFNGYFVHAALPSLTIEASEDWDDRVNATKEGDKAWHFPMVLLADRSAAFRGSICGLRTQRTASESMGHSHSHCPSLVLTALWAVVVAAYYLCGPGQPLDEQLGYPLGHWV